MVDNLQGRGQGGSPGTIQRGAKRGQGRGFGRPGGPDNCVCPSCGYKTSHIRGQRCVEQKCPKCGNLLIGGE